MKEPGTSNGSGIHVFLYRDLHKSFWNWEWSYFFRWALPQQVFFSCQTSKFMTTTQRRQPRMRESIPPSLTTNGEGQKKTTQLQVRKREASHQKAMPGTDTHNPIATPPTTSSAANEQKKLRRRCSIAVAASKIQRTISSQQHQKRGFISQRKQMNKQNHYWSSRSLQHFGQGLRCLGGWMFQSGSKVAAHSFTLW